MKQKLLHSWQRLYLALLLLLSIYVLLDAFLIPHSMTVVEDGEIDAPALTEDAVITESSYVGNGITITITQHRAYDTDIYLADILLDDPAHIRTAFAEDTYGKNILSPTSVIAESHNAILAVNGDYYSARDGYVIRNGRIYRESTAGGRQEALVIGTDGSFTIVREADTSAEALLADGAAQVLSFGPGLIEDGEISYDPAKGIGNELTRNPRTAIGHYGGGHYIMLTADGRTEKSAGLTIEQLAEFLSRLGLRTAYNLDGGGSTTLVFNGAVINQPINKRIIQERNVSDIVYIG